ncbi:unnamed protein product [Adineta steineri]|uniref:Uncharacterized protein n=1 Tax=Adineta steineri TaxID=433720 RepID=A0A815L8C9_9BILA|nr:unnamed protein product [Adineta steineri]
MVSKIFFLLLANCAINISLADFEIDTDPDINEFIYVSVDLIVPSTTPQINNETTLFIWPGLSPWGHDFEPIGNGVLQPVLTYGSSCAPNQNDIDPYQWWISAQYVNTDGNKTGFMGNDSFADSFTTDIVMLSIFSLTIILAIAYSILIVIRPVFRKNKLNWFTVNVCLASAWFVPTSILHGVITLISTNQPVRTFLKQVITKRRSQVRILM